MQEPLNALTLSAFSQLPLWSAGSLAGLQSEQMAGAEPFFKRLINKLTGKRTVRSNGAARPTNEESLPVLADAVVGSSRTLIFSVFGPPGGVAMELEYEDQEAGVWDAPTWYYPLPQNGQTAMAINFHDDYARKVEFFAMPGRGD